MNRRTMMSHSSIQFKGGANSCFSHASDGTRLELPWNSGYWSFYVVGFLTVNALHTGIAGLKDIVHLDGDHYQTPLSSLNAVI